MARGLSLDDRLAQNHVFRRSEDTLGDLIDDLYDKVPGGFSKAVKSKNLGLLRLHYDIGPGAKCIVIDRIENQIFVWNQGQVFLNSVKLAASALGVLRVLNGGPASKEKMVKKVWGYKYHPHRHDSLIYTTIARLRKNLGVWEEWIEAEEDGYQLKSEVQVLFWPPLSETAVLPVEQEIEKEEERIETSPISPQIQEALNHRQIRCLKELGADGISVTEFSERYKATKVTSSRDLAGLLKKGLVYTTGRARATRYFRVTKS